MYVKGKLCVSVLCIVIQGVKKNRLQMLKDDRGS